MERKELLELAMKYLAEARHDCGRFVEHHSTDSALVAIAAVLLARELQVEKGYWWASRER